MRFWDSSAIVPLLVGQPGSAETDGWFGEDAQVAIWTLTPVEVASAVHRLVREGALAEPAALMAEERLDEIVRTCHVVIDVEAVKAAARRLVRLHPLRAADSLQLAAALAWSAAEVPSGVLHTFDRRLGLAARREGFHVLPVPA